MDSDSFRAIYALVQDWAKRTDTAERQEYRRLGIGDTGALFPTVATNVQAQGAKVVASHSFLTYGRFVDMGAGPGREGDRGAPTIARAVAKLENRDANRALVATNRSQAKKVRRPKKFYSVIFYGRLNALMGVVSGQMQETAISLVKEPLRPDA